MKLNLKESRFRGVNVEKAENAYNKCILWFFAYSNSRIGLNELSKLINSSKTATKNAVKNLINEEFILRDIAGKSWILSANQKHRYFTTKKIAYHLGNIYEIGIVEAIHKILPQARAIILFGSYRWGSDTENSDIDIAAEVIGNTGLEIACLGNVERLGYRKNIRVNLHVFSRNKIDLNLFANISNGVVLDGFLEVRP